MTDRRYRLDAGAQRHHHVLIAGSPLKLFRLSDAGSRVVDQIEAGETVTESTLVTSLIDSGSIHPVAGVSGGFVPADVTVVTPAFGRAPHAATDTIVVDDGSDPPLAEATIRLDRNRGPGAARNAGLEHVTTALVAFVDTDVQLTDGWLGALLPHFDDDRVALVAPRVRSMPGRSALARYEMEHSPLDMGPQPAPVRAGSRISYVPAAAVVCRVDVIRDIGGFDETLRFGEDVDLVWRLEQHGQRVRYEPASVVLHEPRGSWPTWFRQRVGYGSSAAPLSRRHPDALAPLRMSGWSIGAWAAGVLAHPIIGAMFGTGSAAALVRKLDDVPPRAAFGLAWRGNVAAGGQIAAAVRRVWWPIALLAGLRSRRARLVLLLSALAARHPVKLLDDVAYSTGVWRGVIRERTVTPLLPEISSWPGRRSSSQRANAH